MTTQPFVAVTFHEHEPMRVHGPFQSQDAACDWLMGTLGQDEAGSVLGVQPVVGKPALTAEAWMLVRMLKAMTRRHPFAQIDVPKVIAYLYKQYGVKDLHAAIDAINQEYKR